jgi:hypothetical protein
MIPRRLYEHAKAHNWFAVAIDFVIVVVGVFIGIQVSNWNEERATRERGKAFSERLLNDLRLEARNYRNQVSYYKEVLAYAERAIASLEGAAAKDEELLINAYRASQYIYLTRHRAVYDELVSTGTIGLISDQKLRETAILLYTTTVSDDIREGAMTSEFRTIFRRTVPAVVQRELLKKCGDQGSDQIGWTLDYPCALDAPADMIAAGANALRSEPLALASLQERFADVETALFNLETGEAETLAGLKEVVGETP